MSDTSPDPTPLTKKIAPVQGYEAGIPWSMHLRAYDVYRKKYGAQEAMLDLEGRGCRGGFSDGELDDWIPGWREELAEINILKATITTLRASLGDTQESLEACRHQITLQMARVDDANKAALERMFQICRDGRVASGCVDTAHAVGWNACITWMDSALCAMRENMKGTK